jgi:uncharacterized lipoprotein YajG
MKKIFCVAILLFLLSACAFTTDHIDLTYTQQSVVLKVPDASNVAVSVQVIDQRLERSNRVGSKTNVYGRELAPIIANEDVTVTIRRAIESELQSRGFTIGNETSVVLLADLRKFWNKHKWDTRFIDAVADLDMRISVKNKNGTVLYYRNLYVQGFETHNQIANGNNARLALQDALGNGMKALFEDKTFIAALIDAAKKNPS